jgi:hypothetical protein
MSLALAGEAEPAPALTVSVVGVRVCKAAPLAERVIWPPGTTVLLEVRSPFGELIRFDAADSALTKFVDDQGADLRAKSEEPENKTLSGFGNAPKIAKDARTCLLEVSAPGVPGKGSRTVTLAGTVSMLCATQKQETVVPNVVLKNGTHIAGPKNLDLELEQVGRPDWGRDPFGLLLRSQRELDDVAEIQFFATSGHDLRATRTATSTMEVLGAVRAEWTYTLAEVAGEATVKIYTWADAAKKRARFELKVELGP